MIEDLALPECLEVTSRSTDDGYIMGVRHRALPIEGVQYHPESILTENGLDLFRSFIKHYLN
jgi:anthranilate synthase component 2